VLFSHIVAAQFRASRRKLLSNLQIRGALP
jgi:hypothetical protein